ncbi:hypothetical protein BJ742DRAFT_806831 [Cladochytrium replicatum]|nr:hypothetical protein BJ742DRAFT_806831 [Cladochytrium replicatum]
MTSVWEQLQLFFPVAFCPLTLCNAPFSTLFLKPHRPPHTHWIWRVFLFTMGVTILVSPVRSWWVIRILDATIMEIDIVRIVDETSAKNI